MKETARFSGSATARGPRRVSRAGLAFAISLSIGLITAVASAGEIVLEQIDPAEVAAFFNSPQHPLPIITIAVPTAADAQDVDKLLTDNLPTVFQISNATGPDVDHIKQLFFQEMAIEYLNRVHFRMVPAGSAAAKRLTDVNVTKPVYVIADPSKSGQDRFLPLDEGRNLEAKRQQLGDHGVENPLVWSVTQRTLEGALYQRLGVAPTFVASSSLSADDANKLVSGAPAEGAAKWARIFFFPAEPNQAANVNRLRALFGMEDFYFAGRVRGFESNLSDGGPIYRTLFSRDPPSEPELWLVNANTHAMIKYAAGDDGPPLSELTPQGLCRLAHRKRRGTAA